MKYPRLQIYLCFLLLTASLLPFMAHANWYKQEKPIMGTLIRVELWSNNEKKAQRAIEQVMQEMHRIDRLMSPYKKNSQLSRINRLAASQAVQVDAELFALLKQSIHFSELTQGAFDITFASVGKLYDYRTKTHPSDQVISERLDRINFKHLLLDEEKHSIRFALDGVSIDLGGIAKGYAVDNSIEILKKLGFKHAIVTAGGDSRIIGDRHGRPWVIGIRDPRKANAIKGRVPLIDSALSTSGDYERYFVKQGEHYHHILKPDTGKSAHQLRSVTIIGPDATTTDALSTSVFVLGPQKGMELVESLKGIEAILIGQDNQLHYSSGMMAQ